MTERKQDLLSQLADLSETAIQKLAEAPGADKVLAALKGLGDRVDELTRRTKGYDELERRVSALEAKLSSEETVSTSAEDTTPSESSEQ
jgi:vacuolar-type H+-ATPase subunit C/Vma6